MVEFVNDIEKNPELQSAAIAVQNDLFRMSLVDTDAQEKVASKNIIGQLLVTPGVSTENADFQTKALVAVATDSAFTEDNDPFGDHSFGTVTVDDQKLFWKIDLYDVTFEFGSERPFDPAVTRRALTIMLPSEY